MTDKEIRLAAEKVVNDIVKFKDGDIKHYAPYKFSISKKKAYYFHDITGTYPAGSASGLKPRIKNAITAYGDRS